MIEWRKFFFSFRDFLVGIGYVWDRVNLEFGVFWLGVIDVWGGGDEVGSVCFDSRGFIFIFVYNVRRGEEVFFWFVLEFRGVVG